MEDEGSAARFRRRHADRADRAVARHAPLAHRIGLAAQVDQPPAPALDGDAHAIAAIQAQHAARILRHGDVAAAGVVQAVLLEGEQRVVVRFDREAPVGIARGAVVLHADAVDVDAPAIDRARGFLRGRGHGLRSRLRCLRLYLRRGRCIAIAAHVHVHRGERCDERRRTGEDCRQLVQRGFLRRLVVHGVLRLPAGNVSCISMSVLPSRRGSLPPDKVFVRRSHCTVCRLPQIGSPAFTAWPIAWSCFTVSGESAPASAEIASGIHWWWKRGNAATCCGVSPSSYPRMPSSTSVMMRLPPGAPIEITLSSFSRNVGVIELSMRLPGLGAFASKPITPKAFAMPGRSAKSSISSLSSTPVPGTTRPEPYSRFTVCVVLTRLPSASMIAKCVVSSSSSGAGLPENRSLGVALSGWIDARRPAA